MDEFHISAEQFAELKKSFERFVEAIKQAASVLSSYCETFLSTLEPYQLYELRHPKKKPRGSIRRNKRNERKKKRNGLIGVNIFVDDVYDLMSIEDNKRR